MSEGNMDTGESFLELYEESIKIPSKGAVFKGSVVKIEDSEVYVDFGFKSEGVVPIEDFYNKDNEPKVVLGDEVEITLESWSGASGLPTLSKRKADFRRENDRLEESFKSGAIVEALVKHRVKGGLIADVGKDAEINAFIPGSQVDIRPHRNLDEFIGQTVEARIIKLSNDGVVLSRRAPLEERRHAEKLKVLETLKEGEIVSGIVVNTINQGAFVDIGGLEGFIPIGELSWGRIRRPSDVVNSGDEIEVQVLRIEDGERVTLSRKHAIPDPWVGVAEKYAQGATIRGKVVSTTDFGVFIELEPGVEGLVHSSELTWVKRFRHPKEVVDVGTEVEAKVLSVDTEQKRVSLSLKQIEMSPWELFRDTNHSGAVVKGVVRNANDKGVFVEVADGIVGLVRPADISWKERVVPEENYKVGDEIEVVVLKVDPRNQRVALGIKQMHDDPWKKAQAAFRPHSTTSSKVVEITSAGLVLELNDEVTGFIRTSEFSEDRRVDLSKAVSVGDEITAKVTGFDGRNHQVLLSKRLYEADLEKKKVSSFMSSQGDAAVTLGDIFGEKLKGIVKQ